MLKYIPLNFALLANPLNWATVALLLAILMLSVAAISAKVHGTDTDD